MRGAVLYAPGDIRVEELDDPRIIEPTDAILRLSATCVCGSDLWPYRGVGPIKGTNATLPIQAIEPAHRSIPSPPLADT